MKIIHILGPEKASGRQQGLGGIRWLFVLKARTDSTSISKNRDTAKTGPVLKHSFFLNIQTNVSLPAYSHMYNLFLLPSMSYTDYL